MTSFHGKGVREQVCPCVCLSVRHAISNISTERHRLRILVRFCISLIKYLRIHAVRSGPLMSAYRTGGYCEMYPR